MKYCVAANMASSPTTPVPLSGDFFASRCAKRMKWGMTPLKSMCRTSLFWIFRPFRRACGKRAWKWRRLGRARSTADMGFICAMQMSKGSRNCLSGCARLSTVRRS